MMTFTNNFEIQFNLNTEPFPWLNIDQFLNSETGSLLSHTYPTSLFQVHERLAGDNKQYRFSVRQTMKDNQWLPLQEITQEWQQFLRYLDSKELMTNLEKMTGLSLSNCSKDIGLFRFDSGDWVSPHTDRPEKKLTFVIYLNEEWESSWGGSLAILKSGSKAAIAYEKLPLSGNAVGILRADNSWHMVTPVAENARSFRKTVQVEFWEKPRLWNCKKSVTSSFVRRILI